MRRDEPILPKPDWVKVPMPSGPVYADLRSRLKVSALHTVCQEALCPNMGECWTQGTATIMLLGEVCTRGCRFCNVKTGNPRGVVDLDESARVAGEIIQSHLKYVVLTCVDRDDLPDGGASVFADTVRRLKAGRPELRVETLISDYRGSLESLRTVVESGPDVVAHNVECARRLTPEVRDPRASFDQSLTQLRRIKEIDPARISKSSIMVGLGETFDEVMESARELRQAGVDIVTFGQYLRPSRKHLPVRRYWHPDEFKALETGARELGFLYVASGVFVRSSYRAAELFLHKHLETRDGLEAGSGRTTTKTEGDKKEKDKHGPA